MFEKKFLMPLLCLVVVLCLSVTATRGANILFVSSMTAVEDDALKAFMEGLGHTVTYIDDDEDEATTEAAAAAADLVFISESVGSGGIKNEITEIETPMIVGEPWAWDEMGLTEGGGGDDPAVTTDVEIVDPGHYMAAGLSGTVAVLTDILEGGNLGKGITGPEATAIATATLSDGQTYDVIFVYEKGAALPVAPADGSAQVAADIRIGFGFHAICYPVLSENAYALLGAAVDYALGLTGPVVDMEIGFAAQPPVIDGEVDGIWTTASTQYIVPVGELADASGSWQALYDSVNLYVIVDISDESLMNDSASSWQDDSVEVYFDGGNTKVNTPLSGDDHQYTFGWTTDDIQGTNVQGATEGIEHAQVDTDTGWRIEIKMPWLSIQGAEPQAGDLIGIDCYYNDDDDGGDSRENKLLSFSAVEGWNDASQWGTAMLAAEPEPEAAVPVSLGAVGDIELGNDNQVGPDSSSNGSGLGARDISARRRVALISYDISALKGRGPISNVSFSHFSHDQHGETNVYGVIEDLDLLDVESLTWNTAPGVQNDPTPELEAPVALDLADLTDVLLTFTGPGETGVRFSTDTSDALADFINSDTDGIVTFLLAASEDEGQLIIRARTHSAGGSLLEGNVLLPAPVKLDVQNSDDPNNVEEGFTAFTFADSGSEIDGITVTLGGYAEADTRRRGEPNGVPYENIYKDFIFARQAEAGIGYVTVTLSGLIPNQTYGITIYSWDTYSTEIRITDWTANGEDLLTTIHDGNVDSPAAEDDQAFTGMATADANGVIFMESVPGEGTFAAEPFAFINALVISPIYTEDPGTDGLVAFYALENDVLDSSGNGNDGTIVGAPTFVDGPAGYGMAMEFHGLGAPGGGGDYIDCGNDASLDITGPISIALWIRPGADDPEGQGTTTAPMAKAMDGVGWSWQVRYGWGGAPQPYMAFTFNTSPRAWAYVGRNLERDEWCHIACSHDGTTLKCYLNGEQTDSTPMGQITSSEAPVLIGSDGWGCDWIGAIDEVAIYNRALSDSEIMYLAGN